MKERPILFSGAMVRALLDGSKTQTRRIVRARPWTKGNYFASGEYLTDLGYEGSRGQFWAGFRHPTMEPNSSALFEKCPYGPPGDRLYVRETWQGPLVDDADAYREDPDSFKTPEFCEYAADGGPAPEFMTMDDELVQRWRPSIHMPRWASRITLEITNVRVERLQAMEGQTAFESDALKEGIKRIHHGDGEYGYHVSRTEPHPNNWTDPCDAFRDLWDSLNAARGHGWVTNPWVWVVEFKRIEA